MISSDKIRLRAVIAGAALGLSCAASEGNQLGKGAATGSGSGSGTSSGAGGSTGTGSSSGGSTNVNVSGSGGTSSNGGACAVSSAEGTLIKEPVDIILVLDNSGSMADELQAVEDNINVNFANILAAADVDYRVILFSRHRKEARADSGESSTSICVSAPLSGLDPCPGPSPVNAERFFHYNEKIESDDSLDWILAGYNRADMRSNPPLTLLGYSEWLRPGAKKVFLELTDANEDISEAFNDAPAMSMGDFVTQLQTLAPEHFGTDPAIPDFVFHSIIGIKEKADPAAAYLPNEAIESATCTGGGNKVTNAGEVYQELSILTGGLRFPLCQFAHYDTVFNTIATDVATRTQVACDFPIPTDTENLELDNVAVNFTATGGVVTKFGQAATSIDCQADAFYIEGANIFLCPEACDVVRSDPEAKVDVLFTCESQIIVK